MKRMLTFLVASGALVVASGALAAMVDGTADEDRLRGTMQADVIRAFAGTDFVNARAGNDLVRAGAGADVVHGDNGSDIVFGGPARSRAFVTCARRGQAHPNAALLTPGVGRADVWVYAVSTPSSFSKRLELFTDTPRDQFVPVSFEGALNRQLERWEYVRARGEESTAVRGQKRRRRWKQAVWCSCRRGTG